MWAINIRQSISLFFRIEESLISGGPEGIHFPITHRDSGNNPLENDDVQSDQNEASEIKHCMRWLYVS